MFCSLSEVKWSGKFVLGDDDGVMCDVVMGFWSDVLALWGWSMHGGRYTAQHVQSVFVSIGLRWIGIARHFKSVLPLLSSSSSQLLPQAGISRQGRIATGSSPHLPSSPTSSQLPSNSISSVHPAGDRRHVNGINCHGRATSKTMVREMAERRMSNVCGLASHSRYCKRTGVFRRWSSAAPAPLRRCQ